MGSSLSSSSLSSMASSMGGEVWGRGPAFVFVIDVCMEEEELRGVKSELLRVVEQLPESALVALVTFDAMVNVYDLGFSECSRVVVFHGDRELSSQQVVKNKKKTKTKSSKTQFFYASLKSFVMVTNYAM